MTIIQIALLGVFGTLLALQFKSGKSEYGIYLSIAVSLVVFFCMSGRLSVIVDTINTISGYIKIDSTYINAMLKMLGVTYLAEFASGICKDAGYQTIAGQIEIFAKLSILALSMPVLTALLQTIQEFLS
ncbi:stage III sporulation AC/AD family protein [Bariatricus massiliensis]|uniref:Stage III sporulation AC/AD family protein n=1 Tax=Bariatricus massiliensis TaxID=1745713 RepID=A0ABS8DD37_9FIRM|nr:SpoIIIAC/SpoIIIAD family protein [Bariatricus massiliensis]MCB7303528.1 stage III sporulation AC/AD family protein [Bariatricus massiliensis]MCB7373660.1 stage III sporulation AC/AD family protein [Bariatricus massiliensis]MCB7386330.1 stage III sporulation AC/AD family protein [Bariatricus massiliensis]MCB7410492.1 stage III sporulation AC/AD family protein [Bariatricus massiliensis]MCQ5252224.1 stage III sporulation AC/AD family protein [Bariatricus massiliensis]